MKKLIAPLVVVVALAAGVWYLARPKQETLGLKATPESSASTQPAPSLTPIGDLKAEQEGTEVAIEGVITKECPHTGCWANVKDETGEIRIDTNAGGFTLPLHREGSKVKVVGKVKVRENGDLQVDATSAEL